MDRPGLSFVGQHAADSIESRRFEAHWESEDGSSWFAGPKGVTIGEALVWARAQSPKVVVGIGDEHYSAGATDVEGLEAWPGEDAAFASLPTAWTVVVSVPADVPGDAIVTEVCERLSSLSAVGAVRRPVPQGRWLGVPVDVAASSAEEALRLVASALPDSIFDDFPGFQDGIEVVGPAA